jgi:hypothetical protein
MKPSDLREYSPLTWGLGKVFLVLQRLSLSTWILGTRVGAHGQFTDESAKIAVTKRRSRQIEAYVLAWLAVEAGMIVAQGEYPHLATTLVCVSTYRLLDIFQASMNLTIFDRLRLHNNQHYVAAIARTVVLSLWNFLEAIICFGIIYAAHLDKLKNATDRFDAFYFSTVTQLTIGYGDLFPMSSLRAVAMTQGLFGFLLGVFAISRVVAFLPKTQSVLGDE